MLSALDLRRSEKDLGRKEKDRGRTKKGRVLSARDLGGSDEDLFRSVKVRIPSAQDPGPREKNLLLSAAFLGFAHESIRILQSTPILERARHLQQTMTIMAPTNATEMRAILVEMLGGQRRRFTVGAHAVTLRCTMAGERYAIVDGQSFRIHSPTFVRDIDAKLATNS